VQYSVSCPPRYAKGGGSEKILSLAPLAKLSLQNPWRHLFGWGKLLKHMILRHFATSNNEVLIFLSFCEQYYTVIYNIFGINCSMWDKETSKVGLPYENLLKLAHAHSRLCMD